MPKRKRDSVNRVGDAYQAVIPEFRPDGPASSADKETRDILLWRPDAQLSDAMLDDYILTATRDHGYSPEQALGLLQWQDHDLERSLVDLQNFTPVREEWTVEDKRLFELAFTVHGKNFRAINQMLPEKPVASLVAFYYRWKKTQTGVIRKATKLATTTTTTTTRSAATTTTTTTTTTRSEATRYNPVRARRRPQKFLDLGEEPDATAKRRRL